MFNVLFSILNDFQKNLKRFVERLFAYFMLIGKFLFLKLEIRMLVQIVGVKWT